MTCNISVFQNYTPSVASHIYKPTVIAVSTTLVIASNTINLIILSRITSLNKINRVFYMNLALADLLVGLSVGIPAIASTAHGGRWFLGYHVCAICAIMFSVSVSESCILLCVISIVRYLAVRHPLVYFKFTKRMCWWVVACAWLYCLMIPTLPIFDDAFTFVYVRQIGMCMPCILKPWAVLLPIFTIMLPCPVILFYTATRIGCILRHYKIPGENRRGEENVKESKATLLLFLAAGCYVLFWTPYGIYLALRLGAPSALELFPHWFLFSGIWLGYCNSFMNVIIYSVVFREFRDILKRPFTSCCYKRRDNENTCSGRSIGVSSTYI